MDGHGLSESDQHTLDHLEHIITCGLASSFAMGQALNTIRDKGLYRSTHPTFEQYHAQRLRLGRRFVSRLIANSMEEGNEAAYFLPFRLASTDTLIEMLTDSQAPYAILELGIRRARRAVAPLIELMQNPGTPWQTAWYVPAALAAIGASEAVESLVMALEKPMLAGPATEALAKLSDPRAVMPLIALFERDPSPSLATALGRWGDIRAVPPLIQAMHHPHAHMRFYTARALGVFGDARALPSLRQAVEHDTELINDSKSTRGKSVSMAASKAIARIQAHSNQSHQPGRDQEPGR